MDVEQKGLWASSWMDDPQATATTFRGRENCWFQSGEQQETPMCFLGRGQVKHLFGTPPMFRHQTTIETIAKATAIHT